VFIEQQELITTKIIIGGAENISEFVSCDMNASIPETGGTPNCNEILSFAHMFAEATNSAGDMMAGWEIATGFGIGTNVGMFSTTGAHYGVTTDAFWTAGDLRLPVDRTLPAFFQPFTETIPMGKPVLQLVSLPVSDIFYSMLSHHVWVSVASQITFQGNNITREVMQHDKDGGGMAARVIDDLTRMQIGSMRVSNLMLALCGQMLWLYGFKPRKQVMQSVFHLDGMIGNEQAILAATESMAMPMMWTGWEILEVAINMPESHVPPLPGKTIKQQLEGGLSWGSKATDRNQVRLSRTMPVIRDYPWLLDGGIDYSMRFYAMDLSGSRTYWHKPNVSSRPKNTPDLPMLYAHSCGWRTIPFCFPRIGQCPSFDSIANEQLSWMFTWDKSDDYEWARMITHQQSNVTSTLSFRFPGGSNAYDENAITRVFPELMADLNDAWVPSIEMSAVYNVSFGINGDQQLGSSAPGNDPRFDSAFRWINVGGRRQNSKRVDNVPRHLKDQRAIGNELLAKNMYSTLPVDPDVKEQVVEESQRRGTTTTSSRLANLPATSAGFDKLKQRAKLAQQSEDDALQQAIELAKRESENSPQLEINQALPDNTPKDKRLNWAEAAKVKSEEESLRTNDGMHQAKLASAGRAREIGRIIKKGTVEEQAESESLPTHYKTDNDETLSLQRKLEQRKKTQGHLNARGGL
jgi:hypothetical protein